MKQSGLGDDLFFAGFHIGGDIQDVAVTGGPAPLDVTGITESGHERIGGLRDGSISVTSFHDTAAGASHAAFSPLPRADVIASYLRGQALGNPVACCVALQDDYALTRAADGMLTFKVAGAGDGFGVEWGVGLTAGLRTDTAPGAGTQVDGGAGFATPAVPASGTPVTNTSPLPASVTVTGGAGTNVTINGAAQGAFDGAYTVPAGGTISLTYTVAPAWTWTLQTASGAQAYLQAVAVAGTSFTVTVEHSPDNVAYSTLMAFSAVSAANQFQRVTTAGTVSRYVRATTTGTFTNAQFQVAFMRNPAAVSF